MKKEQLDDALPKARRQKKTALQKLPGKKGRPTVQKVPAASVQTKKSVTVKNIEKPSTIAATRRLGLSTSKKTQTKASVQSVTLPSNMSERSIEKSVVFMHEVERHFGEAMYKIAYVSGLCFILVGGTLAISTLVVTPLQQSALLLTSVDNSGGSATTSSGNQSSIVTYPKAEFEFLSSVPSNVVEPVPLTFIATNVNPPQVRLIATDGTVSMALQSELIADDKYRVVIPNDSVKSTYFEVRVYLRPLNGDNAFLRRTADFFMGSAEQEYLFNHPKVTPVILSEPENSATSTSIDDVPAEPKEEKEIPVLPKTLSSEAISLQVLSLNGTTISDGARFKLAVSGEPTFIELHARPVNTLATRFITLASKRADDWTFTFDTRNLPNGDYEFFAKTKSDDGILTVSKSIRLTVVNVPTTPEPATSVPTTTTEEVRQPFITKKQAIPEELPPSEEVSVLVPSVSTELLEEHADDFNTLFERYAVAKQTGDESLIRIASEALDEKRESIVRAVSEDETKRDSADRVSNDLAIQMTELQNRIDTFEGLRKQRSGEASAKDTDGDGISDIDELQLYGTNPRLIDTDSDGITDGIEVMRGYDPLDARAEVVIDYQSPKESIGLARKELLVIDEVLPLVAESVTENIPALATEIRGRGLPNSFVTLYIFSSPTVVTVKTDVDGFFVYTFDKELDDGQHDVYVAMTDNAGKIIAQSEPFSFIKTAEAFTPVAAAESSIVSPPPVTENVSTGYKVAVGVGILSFGLILFMLGISLRSKRNSLDDQATDIADTSEASPSPLVTELAANSKV